MGGTQAGGLAARDKNYAKHGKDFYREIGRLGGRKGTTGGFWYAKNVLGDDDAARRAGAIGGKISKRTKGGK